MKANPKNDAKNVAAFMADELLRNGIISQEEIVYEIERRFGEQFVYDNENGNRAIRMDVLREFRKLTPDAVWSSSERYWRKREPSDEAGRKQE